MLTYDFIFLIPICVKNRQGSSLTTFNLYKIKVNNFNLKIYNIFFDTIEYQKLNFNSKVTKFLIPICVKKLRLPQSILTKFFDTKKYQKSTGNLSQPINLYKNCWDAYFFSNFALQIGVNTNVSCFIDDN